MRKSRFMEAQILAILGEGEAGLPVAEVCRKHGISTSARRRLTCSRSSRSSAQPVKTDRLKIVVAPQRG